MKNKLLLMGLFSLHTATPILATGPLNGLTNIAQASVAAGLGGTILTKMNSDDWEEIAIRLGVSIVTMYIMISMQQEMLSGNSFYDLYQPGTIQDNFKSVAGNEDAKDALSDIINYLKDQEKYKEMGAAAPKGILLTGPPGTGKTLLARALAGEANCAFINTTGSSFTEMFVGVGAARIKKLFATAKAQKEYLFWQKPCIIFIDEFDAVAKKRNAFGSNSEDDKTLNELLTAMDGFNKHPQPIIVIASTNHVDNLDPAVLRPGRFDRIVGVQLPNVADREQILKVHLQKIKHGKLSVKKIAQATPGFSGAQLENLVNQAAICAIKKGIEKVTMTEFEEAKDKVTIGSPSTSTHITEYEKRVTAYHEAGHALISILLPNPGQKLHKVSILPRAQISAGGITHFLPEGDIHGYSKEDILSVITIGLGGRAAEELQFKLISTGPSNDLEQVSKAARHMICGYGMHDVLGKQVILPELAQANQYSQETLAKVDAAVSQIIEQQFEVALNLLTTHKDKLDLLAQTLIEKETLNADEVYQLLGIEKQ